MPIWKALLFDGESKFINHLICGEYELNKTSCPNYRKNITFVEIRYILPLKEKEDPEVPSTDKRRRNSLDPNLQHQLHILNLLTNKILSLILHYIISVWLFVYKLTKELFIYFR